MKWADGHSGVLCLPFWIIAGALGWPLFVCGIRTLQAGFEVVTVNITLSVCLLWETECEVDLDYLV